MSIKAKRSWKIAFFVEGMYASGVDTSTRLLAQALREAGHQVQMFSPWKEYTRDACSSDTFLLPAMRIHPKQKVHLSYPISWRLLREFQQNHFDLIHVHTSTSINLLAWQVSRLFQLPIVYTYHTMTREYLHYLGPLSEHMGSMLDSMVELFDKVICDRADLVLTPSAKAADYLRALEVTPDVRIVPNGVDLDRFHPFPSDILQSQYGVPESAKVLLFAGRLNQEKRPLLAYDIFRKLSRQRNDVCLVMVGDGPCREELMHMALNDGLRDRLFLTGLVEHAEMPAIYNAADIWISTSQSEVQPMVALEAAACGLPAVAMVDAALEGIVDDGVNGYVVSDQSCFLTRLNEILNDADGYQRMRQQAIAQGARFSVHNTAKQVAACYDSVLQTKAPPPTKPTYQHRYFVRSLT